jgi:hypothetical protein
MSSSVQKGYAVLLVGVLIAVTGMVVPALAMPAQSAPSCHGQSRPAHSPKPVNFQCCVSGHNPALQTDVSHTVAFVPVGAALTADLLAPISVHTETILSESVTSPPILVPLRI